VLDVGVALGVVIRGFEDEQRSEPVANTRNIEDRQERKAKKRELRRALKETFARLSQADKRRFRKSETKGLRKWIAENASS